MFVFLVCWVYNDKDILASCCVLWLCLVCFVAMFGVFCGCVWCVYGCICGIVGYPVLCVCVFGVLGV